MYEITIVTALFDIGREQFKNTIYNRSIETYIEHFKFWARIQNELIIYTQSKLAKTILEVRESFGLGNRTRIIIVDDFHEKNRAIYERMCKVEKNSQYALWGINPKALRNRADYDYVMLMKYWCLNEAAGLLNEKAVLAWLDFGYNNGGDFFIQPEEFAFSWREQLFFEDRRIHIFTFFDPDDVLLCESLQMMYVCAMGGMVIVPKELCAELWELMKQAMESLLMLDAIDDDQQLLVMAYKYRPEIFSVHQMPQGKWFLPLKEYGGKHLTCRSEREDTALRNFREKHFLKHRRLKEKRHSDELGKELAERIYKAADKYYRYR